MIKLLFRFFLIGYFIYQVNGVDAVMNYIENLFSSVWFILVMMNNITVPFLGDSVLSLIFGSFITFSIVGLILELFNIPRGKFGHYFGKTVFWLVGIPVSFVLNQISKLIFN